jgi:hypothetical protein
MRPGSHRRWSYGDTRLKRERERERTRKLSCFMDHMERFLGTAPVRALSGTPLTVAYSVGQRLKRGRKRQAEYGYVVHVAAGQASADTGRITVLWLRGTTLAPRNAVVTYEGSFDIAQLQNLAKNYEAACTKNGNRPLPQHVTYDMLVDAWYAPILAPAVARRIAPLSALGVAMPARERGVRARVARPALRGRGPCADVARPTRERGVRVPAAERAAPRLPPMPSHYRSAGCMRRRHYGGLYVRGAVLAVVPAGSLDASLIVRPYGACNRECGRWSGWRGRRYRPRLRTCRQDAVRVQFAESVRH